jgi:hypothetical protein
MGQASSQKKTKKKNEKLVFIPSVHAFKLQIVLLANDCNHGGQVTAGIRG